MPKILTETLAILMRKNFHELLTIDSFVDTRNIDFYDILYVGMDLADLMSEWDDEVLVDFMIQLEVQPRTMQGDLTEDDEWAIYGLDYDTVLTMARIACLARNINPTV